MIKQCVEFSLIFSGIVKQYCETKAREMFSFLPH